MLQPSVVDCGSARGPPAARRSPGRSLSRASCAERAHLSQYGRPQRPPRAPPSRLLHRCRRSVRGSGPNVPAFRYATRSKDGKPGTNGGEVHGAIIAASSGSVIREQYVAEPAGRCRARSPDRERARARERGCGRSPCRRANSPPSREPARFCEPAGREVQVAAEHDRLAGRGKRLARRRAPGRARRPPPRCPQET